MNVIRLYFYEIENSIGNKIPFHSKVRYTDFDLKRVVTCAANMTNSDESFIKYLKDYHQLEPIVYTARCV